MAKTETNFKECWYTIYLAKKEFLYVEGEEFVPFPLSIWRSRRIMTDRSKKQFMPFRRPTSHGNTPFRTTFRRPFHPANITRTLLSAWILSAFEVPYVLRLIQSYVVFLQHQIHSSLSGTSVRWVRWNDWGPLRFFAPIINVDCLLFSSVYLYNYLLITYLFNYLFIHSFIYYLSISLLSLFSFFFVHWWADSTEISLTTFIRIITFQPHSRAWQVDLIKYNKKNSLVSLWPHIIKDSGRIRDSCLCYRSFRYKVVSIHASLFSLDVRV